MTICLNTYEPLVFTGTGRKAHEKYGFPPFIDSSCRREPDFESEYPSITALCRGPNFAPYRNKGDIIIYLSYKNRYPFIPGSPNESHWKFVAILEVICHLESHQDAADWYRARNLRLPYNCMVQGTEPFPQDQTCPIPSEYHDSLHAWDQSYWERAQTYPDFLICTTQYLNLRNPPDMTEEIMCKVFGEKHGTQNPFCRLEPRHLSDLKRFYEI